MKLSSWRRPTTGALALLVVTLALVVGLFAGTAPARSNADDVRVVLAAQVNLDPIVGSRGGQWVWGTFLDPLIKPAFGGALTKNGIITDWRRTNARTWRFTVRKGVKFTNGEPGDAYAVANSIMLNKYTTGAILSTYFQNVISARAINPTTVVLRTKLPQFNIANQLTTVFLMPPKYYKQVGTRGFNSAPIGTGPFQVKSLQPGRSISVVPNAGYWGAKAKPSSVTFTYAPDPSQRLALVQSGAADIGVDLGPSQADLAAAAKLKVLRIGTTLKLVLFQFTKGAPLNNINNRKAIALAIDRNKITTGIFRGKARPDGGLLNVIPGTKPATQVNANPAEARKLVQGSPTVTLNYPTDRYPLMPEVAQAIGQMLEDVGFKVKLDPTSYISGVVKVLGGTMSGLWLTGAVPNVPDSNFLAQGFLTSTSITKNCIDKRFDVLTAKALTLKDEKAAKPVYEAMNTLAVSRLACFVPLYGAITNVAMRNNVNGFVFSPLNTMYWDKVTVS